MQAGFIVPFREHTQNQRFIFLNRAREIEGFDPRVSEPFVRR